DLAAEEFRKTVKETPDDVVGHMDLGEVYAQQKKFTEALAEAQKAKVLSGPYKQLARVGALFAAAGDLDEATKILVHLEASASTHPAMAIHIAAIHLALGNKTEAIDWLTKSLDSYVADVIDLKVDPRFDSLRQDPRFIALLGGRMHLLP